jgi:FixJ family two-component response regulator
VIVCSSLEASNEANEAGADSFIQKPIDELKLISEIRRLISPDFDQQTTEKLDANT